MPHEKFKYYLSNKVLYFYYQKIKDPESLENDVDHFWMNLLCDYFPINKNFGLEAEARPLSNIIKKRADWTIRCIRNGDSKRIILMEDKRKGHESQSAAWKDGLEQVTDYMKLVRAEDDQDKTQTLYAAVNIGTYTRFYQLDASASTCIDYPGSKDKAFELAEDEEEVHKILEELARITIR